MICLHTILIVTGLMGDVSQATYCNPLTCWTVAAQVTAQTSNRAICKLEVW